MLTYPACGYVEAALTGLMLLFILILVLPTRIGHNLGIKRFLIICTKTYSSDLFVCIVQDLIKNHEISCYLVSLLSSSVCVGGGGEALGEGVEFSVKQKQMPVFSFRGVNRGLWYPLGCSGRKGHVFCHSGFA